MDKVEGTTDDNRWDQACRAGTILRLVKAGVVEKARWESQEEIKNRARASNRA